VKGHKKEYIFFLSFLWIGNQTQDFMHAKHTFYHWARPATHISCLNCFSEFFCFFKSDLKIITYRYSNSTSLWQCTQHTDFPRLLLILLPWRDKMHWLLEIKLFIKCWFQTFSTNTAYPADNSSKVSHTFRVSFKTSIITVVLLCLHKLSYVQISSSNTAY
jgi:hypothetical protein